MEVANRTAPPADEGVALLAQVRAGSEVAVRALVKQNNRRLYRAARAIVRDDAEAEDVVQETYVRAFSALDGFEERSSVSTWLTRIAVNEALGRLRRRRPFEDLSVLDTVPTAQGANVISFPTPPGTPANPESASARTQVRAMLERAIAELPEAFRAVFMLRDVEQASIAETADLLSIKPETVKTRLHRARALVRESLQGQLGLGFTDLFPFDGARCDRLGDRVVVALKARGKL